MARENHGDITQVVKSISLHFPPRLHLEMNLHGLSWSSFLVTGTALDNPRLKSRLLGTCLTRDQRHSSARLIIIAGNTDKSFYCAPGTGSILHVLTQLLLMTTPEAVIITPLPHFTQEDTEAYRGLDLVEGPLASEYCSGDPRSGFVLCPSIIK